MMPTAIAAGGGVTLPKLKTQRDLPPGETFKCPHCGTRIRTGQVHVSRLPYPHESLATLIKREKLCPGI